MTRPEPSRTPSLGPRLAYLDNIKTLVIVGVIIVHSSLTYTTNLSTWPFQTDAIRAPLEILLATIVGMGSFFGLGLLFLIAGYLTPASLRKKGFRQFLVERALRLGIPLVAFIFIVWPLVTYLGGRADGSIRVSFGRFFMPDLANLDPGPLWFVALLIVLSVVYALLRQLRTQCGGSPLVLRAHHILPLMLGITVATFLIRLEWQLGSSQIFGIELWSWPQYLCLFTLGCIGGERGWTHALDRDVRTLCGVAVLAALLALAVMAAASNLQGDSYLGGWDWGSLAISAVEGVLCVGMCLLVLDVFRVHGNWTATMWRSTGPHSYRAYVIHGPLLVILAVAMRDVAISGYVKFLLLCTMGISLSFWMATWSTRRERVLQGSRAALAE